MSMTATITAEPRTVQPQVTVEEVVATLWGVRPGESRPRFQPLCVRQTRDDRVVGCLRRLWVIAGPR